MKNILLILIFASSSFIAQEDLIIQNKLVEGILYSGNSTFLILQDGYIKINEEDPYEEYYRKIYNDSTIVNPNTVIINVIDLNIIPFLNTGGYSKKHYFKQPLNVGAFIQLNELKNLSLSTYGNLLVDSLKAAD